MKTEYNVVKKKTYHNVSKIITVTIILFLLALKIIFADTVEIKGDNYIDAFNALGCGLKRNENLSNSLITAYEYAFEENEHELIYVAGLEDGAKTGY